MEKQITSLDDKEHILVCLSSAPSNARIIQTAAAMARAFRASFTALYVKTPNDEHMPGENKERLQNNIHLAEGFGATVATVCGDDIPFQIAEYARLSGVTKIVIGRSVVAKKRPVWRPTFVEQVIALAPNIDIHIIPDGNAALLERKKKLFHKPNFAKTINGLLVAALVLLLSTLFGWLFSRLGFTDANIITVYMLGVLITAVSTESKIGWVVSSVASVLVFNFLFTEPKFSFFAYGSGYPVTFIMMLIASLVIGGTAEKMKSREREASKTAYRTKILFEANQLIQKSSDEKEIFDTTADRLKKLLERDIVIVKNKETVVPTENDSGNAQNAPEIARYVMEHNVKAGKNTELYGEDAYTWFPVCKNRKNYGAIGIFAGGTALDSFESSIVSSIIGECAIAIENVINAQEKERNAILAKNEQMRADLLRSISHDLRTPLTSISGNASNLVSNKDAFDEATKTRIYEDIYNDSLWLINLVENLLSVTRLVEGRMNMNFTAELVSDVIAEALKHVHKKSDRQKISVIQKDDLLLAKMDARLIVQVVINLVDNAIKYTPEDSDIRICAGKSGNRIVISVADNGDGIPDEQKPYVFDMFYTGANKIADSRRSIGLGLALCKSIVNAHGGEITVKDNVPHGAVFTFTLPEGEVEMHE